MANAMFFSRLAEVAGTMELMDATVRGRFAPNHLVSLQRQLLPTDPAGSAALTLTGLPAGTDIVVLQAGTATVLLQVDEHPGTSYVYAYDFYLTDTVVDIGLIKYGFEVQYIRGLTLPRTNSTLPVVLRPDRNVL